MAREDSPHAPVGLRHDSIHAIGPSTASVRDQVTLLTPLSVAWPYPQSTTLSEKAQGTLCMHMQCMSMHAVHSTAYGVNNPCYAGGIAYQQLCSPVHSCGRHA